MYLQLATLFENKSTWPNVKEYGGDLGDGRRELLRGNLQKRLHSLEKQEKNNCMHLDFVYTQSSTYDHSINKLSKL